MVQGLPAMQETQVGCREERPSFLRLALWWQARLAVLTEGNGRMLNLETEIIIIFHLLELFCCVP